MKQFYPPLRSEWLVVITILSLFTIYSDLVWFPINKFDSMILGTMMFVNGIYACGVLPRVFGVPFLVIDSTGMTFPQGHYCHIEWIEISQIQRHRFKNCDFLIVFIRHPEKVVAATSRMRFFALNNLLKRFGTPVVISQNNVQVNLAEIEIVLTQHIDSELA